MNAKIVKISFVITMLIIALAVLCGSSVAYAETVMIGGKPVGITIGAKGLVVIETTKVITDDGAKNPTEGKLFKGRYIENSKRQRSFYRFGFKEIGNGEKVHGKRREKGGNVKF